YEQLVLRFLFGVQLHVQNIWMLGLLNFLRKSGSRTRRGNQPHNCHMDASVRWRLLQRLPLIRRCCCWTSPWRAWAARILIALLIFFVGWERKEPYSWSSTISKLSRISPKPSRYCGKEKFSLKEITRRSRMIRP